MNILSFYNHAKYFWDMSHIGHSFYFWHQANKVQSWGINEVNCPENVKFIDNLNNLHYDVALVTEPNQIPMIRETGIDIPIIAVCGGQVPGSVYDEDVTAIVGNCKRNFRNNNHPKQRVIYHSFVPEQYPAYSGDIACLVTIANAVDRRPELNIPLTEQCSHALPHIYIGAENELTRNGIGHMKHRTIRNILKCFRAMVYTPNDVCGMSCSVGEAFITGMPVAISDFGDWSDYIINGVNGFVSNDPNELRRFLNLCLSSQKYAQEVGLKARGLAMDVFNMNTFVSRWNDLLNEVAQ